MESGEKKKKKLTLNNLWLSESIEPLLRLPIYLVAIYFYKNLQTYKSNVITRH